MTETAGMNPEEAAAAARAAEQARIRKERREAKIKAGGSARLNKITGLGGGVQRDPIPTPPPTTSSPVSTPVAKPEAPAEQQHADPEEVDISQHYYRPQMANRVPSSSSAAGGGSTNMSEDQLRQMMLGFDSPASGGGIPDGGQANPFFNPNMMGQGQDGAGEAEDPMMKMLSQMLGGSGPGGVPPFGNGGAGNNPLANLFGAAGMPGAQQQPQTTQAEHDGRFYIKDSYTALWRLLHFLLAGGLGLYIALLTNFSGTKIERERGAFATTTATEDDGMTMRNNFFWTFATAETILLTSRFFLLQGRPPSGLLGTIVGMMPEGQLKSYLGVGLRYSQIFSTLRSDILVCVFVLGVCAWLRS